MVLSLQESLQAQTLDWACSELFLSTPPYFKNLFQIIATLPTTSSRQQVRQVCYLELNFWPISVPVLDNTLKEGIAPVLFAARNQLVFSKNMNLNE